MLTLSLIYTKMDSDVEEYLNTLVKTSFWPEVDYLVINTSQLDDPGIADITINMQAEYPEKNFIVKEILTMDFLGGVLSTLQVIKEGDFIFLENQAVKRDYIERLYDMGTNTISVSYDKREIFSEFYVEVYRDRVTYVMKGLSSTPRFARMAYLNNDFITFIVDMINKYMNVDSLTWDNIINSYVKAGGEIKVLVI